MDKIAEVKRAFEEYLGEDDVVVNYHLFHYKLNKLKAAINALDEPEKVEPIDLKDLKVGDEGEDYAKGWGVFEINSGGGLYPLCIRFADRTCKQYTSDGKYWTTDLRPSIIAVRRKKRMVKKTRTVYINEYAKSARISAAWDNIQQAKDNAISDATKIAVPYVMEYEEPENGTL